MNKKDNISQTNSILTLSSLNSMRNKEKDTFEFRIDFIKNLLKDNQLKALVNFDDDNTTEYFMGKEMDEQKNKDTRYILEKKIHSFCTVIEQMGAKLSYVKSGTSGHTFKGIIGDEKNDKEDSAFNFGVKVVAYPIREKYGDIHDVRRPENAELMMIKLLSYFVLKGHTPHIILPIGTFNAKITTFTDLIDKNIIHKENKKYNEFLERYKNNEYHNVVSILISEWANRGDLLEYIRMNYKNFTLLHWKVIFFQIISTLAVIQYKYPSFRHNDLKANNILIHKVPRKGKKLLYKVINCDYTLPNIGYHIKLWDFDFACIPGIVDNAKVTSEWTKQINVIPEQNRYYDLHYFFNTLIKKGFFPQFMTEECIPKETKEFVNRIVPDKYRIGDKVHKRGRILVTDEYTTPDILLKTDPFFEEFRKQKGKDIKQNKLNKQSKQNKSNKISKSKALRINKIGSKLDIILEKTEKKSDKNNEEAINFSRREICIEDLLEDM